MKRKRRNYLITFYSTIVIFGILVGTSLCYLAIAYDVPPLRTFTMREKLSPKKKFESDSSKPTIKLIGPKNMTVAIRGAFIDFGAEAFDSEGNLLEIVITGSVDTSTPGVYIITYTARDKFNNEVKIERTVTVPKIDITNQYVDANIIDSYINGRETNDTVKISTDGKNLTFSLTFGYDTDTKIIKFKIKNTGNLKIKLNDFIIENNPLATTGINILWPDISNRVLNPGEISEEYSIKVSVGETGTRKTNNIKAYLNYTEYTG